MERVSLQSYKQVEVPGTEYENREAFDTVPGAVAVLNARYPSYISHREVSALSAMT